MTVEVYYKSGKEKHFKNVMSINTGCSYNGDKPQFEISLFAESAVKCINLHEIKGFSITDTKNTWIEDHGEYRCPYCNALFSDELAYINRSNDGLPKFCPACGREVG